MPQTLPPGRNSMRIPHTNFRLAITRCSSLPVGRYGNAIAPARYGICKSLLFFSLFLLSATGIVAQEISAFDSLSTDTVITPPAFRFGASTDSVSVPAFIRGQIKYKIGYDFIRYDQNCIQWQNTAAVKTFFDALANAGRRKVKVVHIGDSHVQADIYTGYVRNRLQEIFGVGGRGFIFPYITARTHPPYDYRTWAAGGWVGARNIQPMPPVELGLMGVSAATQDSNAGFRIVFTDSSVLVNNTLLKIYTRPTPTNYDLKLFYDQAPPVVLPGYDAAGKPYVQTQLPYPPKKIEVWMQRNGDNNKKGLELHGLSLETPEDRGMLYHSVGSNGANFSSILRQSVMPEQLNELKPDLVVIDISGNEYYGMNLNVPDFESKLRGTIQMIRNAAPTSSILITCSQDIYYRQYDITATAPAAELARRVAFDTGCAFYNWFAVAGGSQSMLKWRQYNLAKWDRVHLTTEGYTIKGEAFVNALLAGYYKVLTGAERWIDTTTRVNLLAATLPVPPAQPLRYQPPPKAPPYILPAGKLLTYTVKSGDVLGSIAEQYRVGVMAILMWNNLYSTTIYPGQKLALYVKDEVYRQATAIPAATKGAVTASITAPAVKNTGVQKTATKPKAIEKKKPAKTPSQAYTVRSGDSLWTIARKFKTTVDTLKQLNDLASEQLRPGQKIQVPM